MTIRVAVKPELLYWACERSGHALEAYAARFPKLKDWASGDLQPTFKQLEEFAQATRTPIGYLFLPAPPEVRLPIPDFRTMAGRSVVRASPDLLEMIFVCQQRQEWYRDFARASGEKPLPFVGSASTDHDVVEVAARIRATLGIDVSSRARIPTWIDALRQFIDQADNAGVLVMCSGVVLNNNNRPLDPDEFRGFALADPLAPVVFVNGADTKAAQMFTLAHELAHVWLGQSALSDTQPAALPDQGVERWCNQVAAELLVPLAELRQEFEPANGVTQEKDRLARVFKVSTLVILRRIHDCGGLSEGAFWQEYAMELARLRAMARGSGGGNFYLTQAARVGKRFARALIASTLEGQTLHRDAFRMLGFAKHETFRELGRSLGVA